MASQKITYHIIGGGIAGLACAWILRKKKKHVHITLYEAKEYVGGRAVAVAEQNEESFSFDRTLRLISDQDAVMSLFAKPSEWKHNLCFFDAQTYKIDNNIRKNMDCFYRIFGGDSAENLAQTIRRKIKNVIFNKGFNHHSLWLLSKDIEKRVCNLMSASADDVFYGWRLREMIAQRKKIIKLRFNTKTIDVGPRDKIILAVDNQSCQKFLDVQDLPHQTSANIIYQTSQTIFLPQGVSFVGLKNCEANCIVSEDNFLIASVSECPSDKRKQAELAQRIWLLVDKIRHVNSAFLPAYKIVYNKNAMIKQDEETNSLRPKNAKTQYTNVFIAGDWTMKNYPCRMETAVKSAQRAVKTATNFIF